MFGAFYQSFSLGCAIIGTICIIVFNICFFEACDLAKQENVNLATLIKESTASILFLVFGAMFLILTHTFSLLSKLESIEEVCKDRN